MHPRWLLIPALTLLAAPARAADPKPDAAGIEFFEKKVRPVLVDQCQQCHGPVQEMPVVYQYSSLKMGWCVSCHRQNLNHPEHPATMDCIACHH